MNNFREQYKKDAAKHIVPSNLIRRTARLMSNPKSKTTHSKIRVLVPIVIIIALSCTTVFAGVGYYIKYRFDKSPYESHIATNVNGFEKQEFVQDNVKITVNNAKMTKDVMYVSFDFETLDKSPLQKNSDTEKSILFRQGFAESYIECNGKKYDIFLQRKDTATIPNKATFEAEIIGFASNKNAKTKEEVKASAFTVSDENTKLDLSELLGKESTLVLKDFVDNVSVSGDIGFTLDSLADITKQGKPCTDFVVTGKYIEYADGTSTDSYTLPAGQYKIPFSSKYPNAYIDNFGFKKSGETVSGDYFYLSITPSSEAEKVAFRELAFKSKTSGNHWGGYGTAWGSPDKGAKGYNTKDLSNYQSKIAFDGDRIVIALSGWEYNQGNVTSKDLSDLILVTGGDTVSPILQKGSWKVPFIAQASSNDKVFKLQKTIGDNHVDTITITSLTMHITGSSKDKEDKNGEYHNFRLLMKDGTEVAYNLKTDGWLDQEGLTLKLDKEINPADVVAIRMWGQEIPLK